MKPFSITAPEEIAKDYGGDKRKIQQAAARGLIDPTSAVLAGMFIDRIRGAAAKEQAAQPSVAEQVMNPMPQPQMPSAGLAASPQAAQMQQPAAPRMGQPAMGRMPQPAPAQMPPAQQPPMQQPMGMAMGGGLDSIDYVEQGYAPGGIVSFSTAGGVSADEVPADRTALLERRNELENALRTARIQGDRDALTGQINAIDRRLEPTTSQGLTGLEQGKAMERQAQAEFAAAANQQVPNIIPGGTDYPTVPTAPGQLDFEVPAAPPANLYGPEGRIDPNRFDTGTLTEEMAREIEGGEEGSILDAITPERPVRPAGEFLDRLGRFVGGRKVVAPEDRVGLAELLAGRNIETVGQTEPDAYTGATVPATQTPSTVEDRRGSLADQIARMRDGTVGRIISDPAEIAALEATPEGRAQATVADQIAQTQQTTTPAAETEQQTTTPATEDDVLDRAAAMSEAENQQMTGERPMSITEQFNVFQEEMSDLMPKPEYGEYRKKFENMIDDFDKTKKEAKKDGFNMALLQAGLGMLAQGGGQTALQALGKAALPATKQYAKDMKDLKKEERELFKLGLTLEQMDAKERAAANRTMVNLFGRKLAGEYQLEAQRIAVEKQGIDAKVFDALQLPEDDPRRIAAERMLSEKYRRAQASAAARAPYQQTGQALNIAEFFADAEKTAADQFDAPFNLMGNREEAKSLGITVDELRTRRIQEARTKAENTLKNLMGSPSGQTTGGASSSQTQAAPMEAQDKNGRPIVSYDGGQNWVYK